jgi:hypothetical protein
VSSTAVAVVGVSQAARQPQPYMYEYSQYTASTIIVRAWTAQRRSLLLCWWLLAGQACRRPYSPALLPGPVQPAVLAYLSKNSSS